MSAVLRSEIDTMSAVARYNPYIIVHKGLRAFMTDVLMRWGRLDALDDGEIMEAHEQATALFAQCVSHLKHENEFIHTAIERVRPGFTAQLAREHVQHEVEIKRLQALLGEVMAAPLQDRRALANRFYQELSVFIAENFEHMVVEETENFRALTEAFSEAEVLAIEHAIVASLTPEESMAGLRWMIGSSNAGERAFILGGMKAGAPPEAFAAVMQLAREVLTQRDYYKLERALA